MQYLSRIWQLRYFWFSLVLNDLRSRYKRSFLGVGWSLVRPISMTAVFCLVFGKLFNVSMTEYAPYLLVGMTLWQFITESLIGGCQTFTSAGSYIRQQQVPLAIFPLRSVLGTSFHALIALSLALLFIVFFKGIDNPLALINLIPGLILLFLLGFFLAIISGLFNAHFPDTQHLLEIGLQILFYLTPVLYRTESLSGRDRLVQFLEMNPLTSVLAIFRSPLVDGVFPAAHHWQVAILLVGCTGILAMIALRKLERTLVFWI